MARITKEKQTQDICMEAVKQEGMALDYVKEQTHEIFLVDAKQEAIRLAAVKQDRMALDLVKEDLAKKNRPRRSGPRM